MKWQDRQRSGNVRRGGGAPIAVGGGIGGIVIMLLLYFLGINPSSVSPQDSGYIENQTSQYEQQYERASGQRGELEDFLAVVLHDTEDVWQEKFAEQGENYEKPTLNLYEGSTRSACGIANSQMGPFYCPEDQTVYIDVSFYDDLVRKFGGGGDFALAYVLAHEIGHHVQNELGILSQTNKLRQTLPTAEYNKVSVALELQADYFAGLFAYYEQEKGYLDYGDIDEAMNAASAIGDDRIQEMSGQRVNVDTFTHGSSAQRKEAFDLGYKYHDFDHSMVFFDNL